MVSKKLVLNVTNGLHARPVSEIVSFLEGFSSTITLSYNGASANAKSTIGLLTLGVKGGAEIEILVEGKDEEAEAKKFADFLKTLAD